LECSTQGSNKKGAAIIDLNRGHQPGAYPRFEKQFEKRSFGARSEAYSGIDGGGVWEGGLPPPQKTRGLGERRELPAGSGAEPDKVAVSPVLVSVRETNSSHISSLGGSTAI